MAIEWKTTQRGFRRGEFKDRYGADCSVQESSLATEHCIWVGVDKTAEGEKSHRMHLDRKTALELGALLVAFGMTAIVSFAEDET